MSLYFEASGVLENANKSGGSLKSRIYKERGLKNTPAHIYALLSETSKWSIVLKDVIELSGILKDEKKLTPTLALLLVHDLLLSKSGIAAPPNHPLTISINRHKARLNAEFTKARLRYGFSTIEIFREHINDGWSPISDVFPQNGNKKDGYLQPRWIRVNTLRTNIDSVIKNTFAGYEKKDSIQDLSATTTSAKVLHIDQNIPNLLAIPRKIDITKSQAYLEGNIIFQDKASCFPAYLLNAQPDEGDLIDACAAPGNKTTHLAAIVSDQFRPLSKLDNSRPKPRIFAYERDKIRAQSLSKMVKLANADQIVTVNGGCDFLNADPDSEELRGTTALLLDPSCSGSGIVGRDDGLVFALPSISKDLKQTTPQSRGKKRKRSQKAPNNGDIDATSTPSESIEKSSTIQEEESEEASKERLESLSAFQLKLLQHAMSFPSARKITYSTCSIHYEENESVVIRALTSPIALQQGWRILKRENQVEGLRKWHVRGSKVGMREEDIKSCKSLVKTDIPDIIEACIRCEKGTDDGTMGFFVAGFVRDGTCTSNKSDLSRTEGERDEEEWGGFED